MFQGRFRWLFEDLGAAFLILLALVIAVWPAVQDGNQALWLNDSSFNQIGVEQLQDVVLHGADWREAPLNWPAGYGTAQSDWQAGQALLGLPLRLLAIDPSRAALFLAFAGLLATGFVGHRLARALLGPGPHTWLAGVLMGFSTVALAHLQHVNLIHHEAMVLAALLLGLGLERDRPGVAAAGSAVAVLAFHFGIYMGVHALAAAAGVALAAALAHRGSRQSWRAAAIGALVASLTVLPVLRFYHNARAFLDPNGASDVAMQFVWDPGTALLPLQRSWLDGLFHFLPYPAMTPGHPGYIAIALAAVGLGVVRGLRPRWAWGAVLGLVAFSLVLALGTEIMWRGNATGIPAPYALLVKLPGFEDLRDPYRWTFVAFLASALLSAAGLRALLALLPPRGRLPAGLIAVALVIAEAPHPRTMQMDRGLEADVYRTLSQLSLDGAVWDVLAPRDQRQCTCSENTPLRAALLFRRPLCGGHFARTIPATEELIEMGRRWPSQLSADYLGKSGVVAVVEHPPTASFIPQRWTCEYVGDHRLCVVAIAYRRSGFGHPPDYTGLPDGSDWVPPLPVRDRDLDRFPPTRVQSADQPR